MDILELDGFVKRQEEGAWVAIRLGDAPSLFRVKVAGPDSARARQARYKAHDASLSRAKVIRSGSAAVLEHDSIVVIAGTIMAWEGLEQHGKPVPYSENRAVEILSRYRLVREQVERASQSRWLFATAPAKPDTPTPAVFDLAKFDELNRRQNEGVVFPILDATNEPTGISVKVAGPDSAMQQNARDIVNQRLVDGGSSYLSPWDRQRDSLEILTAAILDWEGVTRGGEDIACTPDEVATLLTQYPIVRDQVDFYASTRQLFAVNEAKND